MLELENIDEFDLKGILFTEFPVELLYDEARERLELLILECHEEYWGDEDEEVVPKPAISPYWVWMALRRKNMPKFQSKIEFNKAVKQAKAKRKWVWQRAKVLAPNAKGAELRKVLHKASDQYEIAVLNQQLKDD